jgi:hypothetical protein
MYTPFHWQIQREVLKTEALSLFYAAALWSFENIVLLVEVFIAR